MEMGTAKMEGSGQYGTGISTLFSKMKRVLQVLPAAMRDMTTACEAGVTAAWYKYADKENPKTPTPRNALTTV